MVDGDRQQAAYLKAKEVFLDYLCGEMNNDVGSALDFAFEAWRKALGIQLFEPAELSIKPPNNISLVINLKAKEYRQWERISNLNVGAVSRISNYVRV